MSQSVYLNGIDITAMVTSITWSGSMEEVGRKCDITYLNAPYDDNLADLPTLSLGDYITLEDDDDGELFYGRIYGAEKSSAYGTITANCVDDAQLLLKSNVKYSYVGKTPEEIAQLILADLEFPTGDLASTGYALETFVADGISAYDAIQQAYEEVTTATGTHYIIGIKDRYLSVWEYGGESSGVTVSESTNITESHYSESTDTIVNRVVIYDTEGNRIGEVEDSSSMSEYGTYQEIYEEEENVEPTDAANALLSGPDQSLSVTAIGENACVAGTSVTLYDTATDQSGTYWIKNDSHTYENNIHLMTLELSYEEVV